MTNRTDELRQQMIQEIDESISIFEECGTDNLFGDYVSLDYVAAKRISELLKKLEVPVYAVWEYYVNDEGKARWRCSNCHKVCRRNPYEKKGCSNCRAIMRMEA